MREFYKKYFLKKKCCKYIIYIVLAINIIVIYFIIDKTKKLNQIVNPVLIDKGFIKELDDDHLNYKIYFTVKNEGGNGNLIAIGELIKKDTTLLKEKSFLLKYDETISDTIIFKMKRDMIKEDTENIDNININYNFQIFLIDSLGNLSLP